MTMRQIFLIISMGVLLSAEFSRDDTGVVADSRTNLLWQDLYGNGDGAITQATWQDALIYCEELTFGGNSDWRLPNMVELKSIREIGKIKPSISSVFKMTTSNYYWTSTAPASSTINAWVVDFYNGHGSWNSKQNSSLVRCVRGGL